MTHPGTANLKPFTGVDDPRRRAISPGRPSRLADPEFVEHLAICVANGMTREAICEEIGAKDVGSITRWKRDPRVKAAVQKVIKDRITLITSRTDAAILKKLDDADNLTVKEIVLIRQQFLGGKMRETIEDVDEETVNDLQDWLSKNPDDAAALDELLSGQSASTPSNPE